MLGIDRTIFPLTAAYIESLPEGLDSYPQCLAKASLYRRALDNRPFDPVAPGVLPDPLRDLIEHPRAISSWIREAPFQALMTAQREQQFATDTAFFDFVYRHQMELYSSALYSIMLRLASPGMLLRGASMRWSSFHRGSTLRTQEVTRNSATIILEYPNHLFDRMSLRSIAIGFKAALDASCGRGSKVEIGKGLPGRARFESSWR